MARPEPPLGSRSLQSPAQIRVHVSQATCLDISSFKEVLREFRKLDDAITMRLNRENAMVRDQERAGHKGSGSVQEQACKNLWDELTANWKQRTRIISYCTQVMDQSKLEKEQAAETEEDAARRRRALDAAAFAHDVMRNQVHNELSVDQIVIRRSLQAFRSRCRSFHPPDNEARKFWDMS
ncbi:caffeine-induced death protein 2-domain-containing protein [Roridomyces roridus]|uniref:Caffeine-induced death protein 2-domain-containing protein n=1 Tax=Roridomyces roridus TaxID=1738132 RepID=A0AAD7C4B8_9AGAR|nr:caffeine-induced death protein 2-domain-containing protein [Roridomyces roridus]